MLLKNYHQVQLIATMVQLAKLKRFINFSALIYCPWWFLSTSAPDAPYNDLMLLKSVMDYAEVDKLMSNSAQKAVLRHLYGVPEMIPLFSVLWFPPTKEKESQKKTFTV